MVRLVIEMDVAVCEVVAHGRCFAWCRSSRSAVRDVQWASPLACSGVAPIALRAEVESVQVCPAVFPVLGVTYPSQGDSLSPLCDVGLRQSRPCSSRAWLVVRPSWPCVASFPPFLVPLSSRFTVLSSRADCMWSVALCWAVCDDVQGWTGGEVHLGWSI